MNDVIWRPSPNFGERRGDDGVRLVVLHHTVLDCAESLARLCDPVAEVSAHYLISAGGDLFQMVDLSQRAWHAGAGRWGRVTDVNSASIGIEIENDGGAPFSHAAMTRLEALLAELLDKFDLPAKTVIGHSDMAPSRKSDPGPHFDWQRLARIGLAVWPENRPYTGDFIDFAGIFGYPIEVGLDDVLRAFRMRFRPHKTGPLDEMDVALIGDLAQRFPAA